MSPEDELDRLRRLIDQQNHHPHYLREWRIRRRLSPGQLAWLIGKSSDVIETWETGNYGISLEDQFKLMAALSITPAQFFSWPTEGPPS
jgi:hypothetical protein